MKKLAYITALLLAGSLTAAEINPSLMPGNWTSPRHDYIYKANGTWYMAPEGPNVTKGTWSIKGDQLKLGKETYTIQKLTKTEIIFSDSKNKFRMERTQKLPPTPEKTSNKSEKDQIEESLLLDYYKNKERAKKNPDKIQHVFNYCKIKGEWACINTYTIVDGKEFPKESTWAILHKYKGEWTNLYYAIRIVGNNKIDEDTLNFRGDTSKKILKAIPEIPPEILP